MSWRDTKDAGKQAFTDGSYSEALTLYSDAIDQLLTPAEEEADGSYVFVDGNGTNGHTEEHQILLSNVIACRLKIGGEDMSKKAVDEAKQCISLNNQWSKAHVRLASAYIALGGHSNDACVSLQRALSQDRNNKVAREMLVKEMRQRNNRERTGSSSSDNNERSYDERNGRRSSTQSQSEDGMHPTDETPQHEYPEASAPPPEPADTMNNSSNYDGIDVDDIEPPDAYHSLTFYERIQHRFAGLITWFYSQSDDIQTLLKVACCFLVLYVALGGRFGLDYAIGGDRNVGRRGNYQQGNAYERYSSGSSSSYQQTSAENRYSSSSNSRHQDSHSGNEQQRRASSGYNDQSNSQNNQYYSRNGNGNDPHYEPRGRRQSTSFHMPNLYDGSMASMAILLILGLCCHRFGINPFQAMWMLNMLQRRGGQHRMGRHGYGGYQGGRGGGFGGFGRGRRRY